MRKAFLIIICIYCSFLLFFSCSKEYSFENGIHSEGYFRTDTFGDCLPFSNSDNFIAGTKLTDSTTITAPLYIKRPGTYHIYSDTINGYYFQAYGNFKDTGLVALTISGTGKPIFDGIDEFTIYYNDSSFCHFPISVKNHSVNTDSALFTLNGFPNSCINDSLMGTYIKGIVLDTSCKIKIQVNVITTGNYFVSTNSVNGYLFSGNGVFTSTGINTLTLTANGTPLNSGTDIFTITATSTSCTFSVEVPETIITNNNDHFPLTKASFWTYDDLYHTNQMISRAIVDTARFNGNLYTGIEERFQIGGPNVYYFRKTGSDYLEYGRVDKYTSSVVYVPEIDGDIAFLHENLKTADSWNSTEYSGTINGGQTVLLQYVYTCVNANAGVTINGKAFSNVYKIIMKPRVRSLTGSYNYTGEQFDLYYAKGVGLIYSREKSLGYNQSEMQIRNWQVN